jgi:hypothetical protein
VGLLGAVAGFLTLALLGLYSDNQHLVRGAYAAMQPLATLVIVPLAYAALLIGLLQSLGTRWGLFRHYWVVAKLLLSILIIVVLLLQLDSIGRLADVAAVRVLAAADLPRTRLSVALHAGAGLLVLLLPLALSIYKPRGTTALGRGRRRQRSASPIG